MNVDNEYHYDNKFCTKVPVRTTNLNAPTAPAKETCSTSKGEPIPQYIEQSKTLSHSESLDQSETPPTAIE